MMQQSFEVGRSRQRSALQARLTELDELGQAVLEVLVLSRMPLTVSLLVRYLNQEAAPLSRLPARPRQFGGVQEAVKRLEQLGLAQEGRGAWSCTPLLIHRVLSRLLADPQRKTQVLDARQAMALHSAMLARHYRRTPQQQFEDLRWFCYTNESRLTLEERDDQLRYNLQRYDPQPDPFTTLLVDPNDAAWFATRDPQLRKELLPIVLVEALQHLDPVEATLDWLGRDLAACPRCRDLVAELRFWRGEFDMALALAQPDTPSGLLVRGQLAWLEARREEGVGQIKQALKLWRQFLRSRKGTFGPLHDLLYPLALVIEGTEAAREMAHAYLNASRYQNDQRWSLLLHALFDLLQGRPTPTGAEPWLEVGELELPAGLYTLLGLSWLREQLPLEASETAQRWEDVARAAGYLGLADELTELLFRAGARTTGAGRPAPRGYLVDLIQRAAPWERTLAALDQLGRAASACQLEPPRKERLVWFLLLTGPDENLTCSIHSKVQKHNARGGWTAGRLFAPERLPPGAAPLPYLTAQDQQVCAAFLEIRQPRSRPAPGSPSLVHLEQALPLLVGHPLVMDARTGQPLTLLPGTPSLSVTRQQQQLVLALQPPVSPRQPVWLQREGPDQLRVYQATPQQLQLAVALGSGLRLPAAAAERVRPVLTNLAALLPIQSDIGVAGAGVEEVPGVSRPLLLLTPVGAGLRVQLRVRPLGDQGPLFLPGQGGATVLAELAGRRLRTARDLSREKALARGLVEALPLLHDAPEEGPAQWQFGDPEEGLVLLEQLRALPPDQVAVVWPQGRKLELHRTVSLDRLRLRVNRSRDWFEVSGELVVDEGLTLRLEELLGLLAQTPGRFVQLGEAQYLALSRQLRARLDELAAQGEAGKQGLKFHPLALLPLQGVLREAGELQIDGAWQTLLQQHEDAARYQPIVPPTLQAELRDYQREGFVWLARLARLGLGACLADDMGLGKTVQALALLLTRAPQGPALVVAPTSVCFNWVEEAHRFAPTLQVRTYGGSGPHREELLAAAGPFDLVVCSYGLLQGELERLARVRWQTVVLDEAQAIKNFSTKRSQAAMELPGEFRLITTGTPIENNLAELWNLFRFINPGLLGSFDQFQRRFAVPLEQGNEAARGRLRRLIQPFLLRRTKAAVLEQLPTRTEILLPVELSEGEAALYEALRRRALAQLAAVGSEPPGQRQIRILAELMKLRRACCHPALVAPGSTLPAAKHAALEELLDELHEGRHRALIFSQFVDHLTLVRALLERRGTTYRYLDGSTPARDRQQEVAAFQRGEAEVFLISLKAGGTGLNLTAADYVIHLDPWWNPAVEDQASDRAHRIGQQRPVTIYRLVARNTIEEKIVSLHHHKRELANSLLEGTADAGRVSVEELFALLQKELGEPS